MIIGIISFKRALKEDLFSRFSPIIFTSSKWVIVYTAFSREDVVSQFNAMRELMKSTVAVTPSSLFKSSSSSLAQLAQHSPAICIFSPSEGSTTFTSSKLLHSDFTFSRTSAPHST